MTSSRAWLLAASALALVEAHSATAAETPTSLSEIVVTAEKRETNVQKTPISIQTYSGEELAARGVTNVRGLTTIDASVNMSYSAGQNVVAVRGVTSTNATETGEPAVSVAVDGIFNNRGYSLGATLYDLARLEVLRGPQGTLFGRNTTGGMLNIVTNKPTGDYSGRLTAEVGNYNALNFDGFLNLPVTDELAARVSFSSRSHDGYRRSSFGGVDRRVDDEDVQSARLQLSYKPSDTLSFWTSAQLTHEGGSGSGGESIPFRFAPGTPVTATGTPFTATGGLPTGVEWLHSLPPNLSDGEHFQIYGPQSQSVNTVDFKWGLTWGGLPADMTLTYLGGYNRIDFVRPATSYRAFFNVPWTFTRRENPETLQHELRLASATGGPLVWQVGAYYFREQSHLYSDMVSNAGSGAASTVYYFNTPKIEATSKAVFAQASYDLTSALKLTAGARWTTDDKMRAGCQQTFAPVAANGRCVPNQNGSASSEKLTWLVDLDYQITDQNLLYAKVSTGYKGGGFTNTRQYDPETMTSYEVGSKNRFFDNRLQLNLSAYRMEYKDQQVNQYVSINGAPAAATIVNAGASRIWGVESSLVALIEPLGRFEVSASYLHARYTSFLQSAPWNSTVNLNLAGKRLPNAPDLTVTFQYEHTWDDVLGGSITGRASSRTQSQVYFNPLNLPDQRQGGFTTADAALRYDRTEQTWSVEAFVNNLTDKTRFSYADETTIYYVHTFNYAPPRTYGVRLTARF